MLRWRNEGRGRSFQATLQAGVLVCTESQLKSTQNTVPHALLATTATGWDEQSESRTTTTIASFHHSQFGCITSQFVIKVKASLRSFTKKIIVNVIYIQGNEGGMLKKTSPYFLSLSPAGCFLPESTWRFSTAKKRPGLNQENSLKPKPKVTRHVCSSTHAFIPINLPPSCLSNKYFLGPESNEWVLLVPHFRLAGSS